MLANPKHKFEVKLLLDKHQKKIRFLVVGGLNTLFGLSTFPVLFFAFQKLSYILILCVSQIINMLISFNTNKYIVFRTKGNYFAELQKYSLFHCSCFALNLIVLPLLVEVFGVHPVVAQTFFTILIIFSSYLWYSKVTFTGH